jgi:hypothetical protein
MNDKNVPNFKLNIKQYQRNSCEYDPNIDAPSHLLDYKYKRDDTYDYPLQPKSVYTETVELTEKTMSANYGMVKYQFSQKDNYTISAFLRFIYTEYPQELKTESNQLSLLVK